MADQGQVATDGTLNEDSVQTILSLRDASKSARRPRELEWNRAWNLYNNVYDFSKKAEWQSKNYVPRVNTAVRAAAYIIKKGLIGPRDFFSTVGIGEKSKLIAPTVQKMTRYYVDEGNFVNRYVTALMSGLLSSLVIMKVYPRFDDDGYNNMSGGAPAMPRGAGAPSGNLAQILAPSLSAPRRVGRRLSIKYDPINAYDLYLDPKNEGMYKIHEMEMDLFRFKEMAARSPYFERDVVKALEEDFVKLDEEDRKSAQSGQDPASSFPPEIRKRVRLSEFWGTMLDRQGNVLFKNAYALMVNDKYMVVKPRPNPLPNKKDPFIIAPVIEKPFSVWHQGFVEGVAGLQVMMTDLINMVMDGNLYASIKAFELDIDQVYDPTQFQSGVIPGKLYKKRGGGFNTAPMIRDINLGNMNPQVMEVFLAMDREFQNGVGLNEFLLPQMRVRTGRVTATESLQKGQNSADFFSEIARMQEENVICPALEKTYEYALHYQRDFSDPMILELIGPEAAAKAQLMLADPESRKFLLEQPIKFKADGISAMAERMKNLEKVMAFINLIGNVAKAVPEVVQRVNVQNMLKMAVQALNWDENEVLNMQEAPVPPTSQGAASGAVMPKESLPPAMSGGPQPINAASGMAGAQSGPPTMGGMLG
ncbi:MAG: hypothetical protein WC822_02275 [Candidatus Paceibacterota bacterium]|jgi:hypothetical protein